MAAEGGVDLGSLLYVSKPNQSSVDLGEQLATDLDEEATYVQFRLSFDTDMDKDGGADHDTIKDEDMVPELWR